MASSLTLWLPPSARPKFICRVPQDDGTICSKRFYEGEERSYQNHVIRCAKRNDELIQHFVKDRAERLWLRPEWADLEYEDWVREHGRVR